MGKSKRAKPHKEIEVTLDTLHPLGMRSNKQVFLVLYGLERVKIVNDWVVF